MAYKLKAVTIRTNNSEEGIRKIGELWGDVLTGKLSLLADGVVPISQYSNYESDEKGDYDISIVGVEHNFFEDIEKEVEKTVYKGSWKDFHYYQDIYNVAKEKGLLEKYGIEWGGNCWKSFKDAPHWQIKGADKVAFK